MVKAQDVVTEKLYNGKGAKYFEMIIGNSDLRCFKISLEEISITYE